MSQANTKPSGECYVDCQSAVILTKPLLSKQVSSDLLLAATISYYSFSELQPSVYSNLYKCCELPYLHFKNQAHFFTAYSDVFILFGSRNSAGTVECLFMYSHVLWVYKLKGITNTLSRLEKGAL